MAPPPSVATLGWAATMVDETKPEKSSGYRAAAAPVTIGRTTGGSGVQRSHLRDRKSWLKGRTRAGRTWAQRKAASTEYCMSRGRPGSGRE